jgi:hypothetical protein
MALVPSYLREYIFSDVCVLNCCWLVLILCTIFHDFLDALQVHAVDFLLSFCWIFKLKRFYITTIHNYYNIYNVELSDCVHNNLYCHIMFPCGCLTVYNNLYFNIIVFLYFL